GGGAADAAASAGDDCNPVRQMCPHKTDALYWKSRTGIAANAKIKIPNLFTDPAPAATDPPKFP
ncbi:MAG TPA: hypothetical protein VNN81_13640, partial [Bradyrhizobium sp.]|nr:hypothetical protein [Bradyrhizobium sp.]